MAYEIDAERRKLPLKWANLTVEERRALSNGCGGKGGWFDPPDYIFTASCDWHDINYWLGGSEADRKKADGQFLDAMLFDAQDAPWYLRWWYKAAAWRYYSAVRFFGGAFFNYRSSPPTWDDLARVMDS
jgi:hypothetical protein